jgi:hypothetical protein
VKASCVTQAQERKYFNCFNCQIMTASKSNASCRNLTHTHAAAALSPCRFRPCFQKQFYVTITVQITYTRSSTRRLITPIPIQMSAQQLAKACVTGISADVENSERQMTNFYLLQQRREEQAPQSKCLNHKSNILCKAIMKITTQNPHCKIHEWPVCFLQLFMIHCIAQALKRS